MTNFILNFTRLLLVLSIAASCNNAEPQPRQFVYRVNGQTTIDGRTRTYLLNLPPLYYSDSSQFSLVIAMHGTGGSATQFEQDYSFTEKANTSGFIVVYPEGVQKDRLLKLRTWNAGTCCDYAVENNIDDVKFIRELIDYLTTKYRINIHKIYATGMSNGGMMAYRLACEISDKIAAIAVVSATMVMSQPCNPSQPMPILHIHSILDTKVPYRGGTGLQGYYFPAVDSVLNVWSRENACGTTAQVLVDNSQYKMTSWSACNDASIIQCYLTTDGGHAWPGGSKSGIFGDTPSTAVTANDLMWEFFQRFER